MTIIGVTGHANLTDRSVGLVCSALSERLRPYGAEFVGMTCLARGADQAFADAVLELGGALDVVLPAKDYITGIPDPADRARCDDYLAAARSTVTLPYETSGAAAYLAASRYVVDRCELLLAVWDGAAGTSGTAEAVAYARGRARPVDVVWPEGARRD